MSDGAWLEADEVGFEHHPDIEEWMEARGCDRARVERAAQVDGHRWTLLACADASGAVRFLALAQGDAALLESEEPEWLEALERLREGSQSRS